MEGLAGLVGLNHTPLARARARAHAQARRAEIVPLVPLVPPLARIGGRKHENEIGIEICSRHGASPSAARRMWRADAAVGHVAAARHNDIPAAADDYRKPEKPGRTRRTANGDGRHHLRIAEIDDFGFWGLIGRIQGCQMPVNAISHPDAMVDTSEFGRLFGGSPDI